FSKDRDDLWTCPWVLSGEGSWKLVSVPLQKFRDSNQPGDGRFNITYKEGKLFVFLFSFADISAVPAAPGMSFDFICFSKNALTASSTFDPAPAAPGSFCALGAWSPEGNTGNFSDIAGAFMKNFSSTKKLG